jgi:hypothetical protein
VLAGGLRVVPDVNDIRCTPYRAMRQHFMKISQALLIDLTHDRHLLCIIAMPNRDDG